ncbi:MAG: 23S rRNA (uracil(1939)-C(5))-methyltransferase RlmD, partial [Bacteroidales bacterium]|nr:23S rRNA (uracil(1939)-C(5))-methyltransferase RlmD [Bacteroidales bacterium]
MSRKKQYTIEGLEIIDAGSEGKAVGKHEGLTVFVPFAVPGDVVDVRVYKQRKSYAEADLLNIVKPSPDRITAVCQHFGLCGGCKWQVMSYAKQLEYKQKQVLDNFTRLGKFDFPDIKPIVPSDHEYYYRNKLEFTFTDRRWLDAKDMELQQTGTIETHGLGFHIPGKFDKILDIQHCYLQANPSNAIRLAIRNYSINQNLTFYNVRSHEGLLRNLVIRSSTAGELMVIVIFGEPSEEIFPLLDFVAEQFPQITSLQYVINAKLNDTITDQEILLHKGNSFIQEEMEGLTFKIGPVSFYQTNSEQAYKLYQVARDFARITKNDLVYDLYTGTGTIANFVAKQAKKVVGIEYVEAAIEDAWINSRNNLIDNTVFYAGDMAKVLTSEFVVENGHPDIVITDPPRAGMHPKVIEQLLMVKPQRIVYVSCNPAS